MGIRLSPDTEIAAHPGHRIQPDGWSRVTEIQAAEADAREILGAEHRLPARSGEAPLANVTVTGRTIERRHGEPALRCEIEWVEDGRPNHRTRGWLFLTATEYARLVL